MIISGKDGYVNGVPCTTSWSAAVAAGLSPYACSATDGGTAIVEGNINWTGSMSGLGPNPPVKPGEEFAFKGIADNTVGDITAIEGTVLIGNVNVNIPVAGGGPITWTANFGAQGLLTSGLTGGEDSTTQLAQSGKDAGITIDPSGTPLVIDAIQSISLGFAAPNVSYIKDGATERKPGNLSASLTFTVLNKDLFQAGYQPNDRTDVNVVLGDGKFWHLDQIVFGGLTNYQVNVATRAIVGYTVNGMWSAITDADVQGSIILPNLTQWYPETP